MTGTDVRLGSPLAPSGAQHQGGHVERGFAHGRDYDFHWRNNADRRPAAAVRGRDADGRRQAQTAREDHPVFPKRGRFGRVQ